MPSQAEPQPILFVDGIRVDTPAGFELRVVCPTPNYAIDYRPAYSQSEEVHLEVWVTGGPTLPVRRSVRVEHPDGRVDRYTRTGRRIGEGELRNFTEFYIPIPRNRIAQILDTAARQTAGRLAEMEGETFNEALAASEQSIAHRANISIDNINAGGEENQVPRSNTATAPRIPGLVPTEVERAEYDSIPLDRLPANEQLRTPPLDSSFVESLRTQGLLQPIVVQEFPDGRLEVLEGRRRIKAARQLGWTQIDAAIRSAGWVNPNVVTLAANAMRSDNPIQEYQSILELMDEGHDVRAIARATGLDQQTIQRRLRLSDLHRDLLQAFLDGRLAESAAERAVRLPRQLQDRLVATMNERPDRRLRLSDVQEVAQVGADAAAQSLPESLFGEDEVAATAAPELPPVDALISDPLLIASNPEQPLGKRIAMLIIAADRLVNSETVRIAGYQFRNGIRVAMRTVQAAQLLDNSIQGDLVYLNLLDRVEWVNEDGTPTNEGGPEQRARTRRPAGEPPWPPNRSAEEDIREVLQRGHETLMQMGALEQADTLAGRLSLGSSGEYWPSSPGNAQLYVDALIAGAQAEPGLQEQVEAPAEPFPQPTPDQPRRARRSNTARRRGNAATTEPAADEVAGGNSGDAAGAAVDTATLTGASGAGPIDGDAIPTANHELSGDW